MPFTLEEMMDAQVIAYELIGEMSHEDAIRAAERDRPAIERIKRGESPFPRRTPEELRQFVESVIDYYLHA